jgi:DNA polymerase
MFAASDVVHIDFEAVSRLDLKAAGAIAYVSDPTTKAVVLGYAIGDGPAHTWHADGAILNWNDAPDDLRAAVDRGMRIVAFNASFDSAVWNYATIDFPFLEVDRVIDAMVQAAISGLPSDLESASRYLGGEGKRPDGKALIRLFCVEGASPHDHPEVWERFLAYARQDVEAMRDVYRRTRPLPLEEWREYHAFERINRRGVCVDMPFVHNAERLAAADAIAIGQRLTELTASKVTKVTQARRLAEWLYEQLPDSAMRDVLVCSVLDDDDEEGPGGDEESRNAPELSLERERVERIVAMLETKRGNGGLCASEANALEAATLRVFGAGTSPLKFARIVAQQVDGVLRNQYVFSGAAQTGRVSSRGAQIQNLTRDVLGKDGGAEASLVDRIADGCSYAELVAAQPVDVPATRKLGLLVRPAFIAAPQKTFVWSDLSSIEARIPPWLALSEDGDRVLAIFRDNDRDSSLPDLYRITAANILGKDPGEVSKDERQIGKVACLSLGFSGSVGALQKMALNYRIHLDDDEARRIVNAWRDSNSWIWEFWGEHRQGASYGLWGAAMSAIEVPGQPFTAGRIAFLFHETYLGGTLIMALPSGRWLSYPRPKWRDVEVIDKKTKKPTGEIRREMSFRRAHGRVKLWKGTLAENCCGAATQVLTARGWKRIVDISTNDLIFDGVEWVAHGGVVSRGVQETAFLDGVPLTAEHEVLSHENGWVQAWHAQGLHRATVRLPDGNTRCRDDSPGGREQARTSTTLVDAVRLWPNRHPFDVRYRATALAQCLLLAPMPVESGAYIAMPNRSRHEQTPGVLGLAFDARPLPAADAPGLAQLRRAGNLGLRQLAGKLREFLGGYGVHLSAGPDDRTPGQQCRLQPRELLLGNAESASVQQTHQSANRNARRQDDRHRSGRVFGPWGDDLALSDQSSLASRGAVPAGRCQEPVYDILNCGPRHRFVVRGDTEPFIIHNCTQAVAADLLRQTVTRIETNPALSWMPIRLTTHDEVVCECDEARAEEAKAVLRHEMQFVPPWAGGLPLQSEESVCAWYTKAKAALK